MADIVFLVGNSTSPSGADAEIKSYLEGAGHVVTLVDDDASDRETLAAAADTTLVSESCNSSRVGFFTTGGGVPVVHMEPLAWDENAWVIDGSQGLAGSGTDISVASAHPISTGLSSPLTVYTTASTLGEAQAFSGGTLLYRSTSNAAHLVAAAFEVGDTFGVAQSKTAAVRAVTLGLSETAAGALTAAGLGLIERSLRWTTGDDLASEQAAAWTGTTSSASAPALVATQETSQQAPWAAAEGTSLAPVQAASLDQSVAWSPSTGSSQSAIAGAALEGELSQAWISSTGNSSSPILGAANEQAGALAVLFLVGNSASPTSAETEITQYLEGQGHTVTYQDDSDSDAVKAAAAASKITLVSESVLSSLATYFATEGLPVVHMEPGSWDELGWVTNGSQGTGAAGIALDLLNPHPIAAGLADPLAVYTASSGFGRATAFTGGTSVYTSAADSGSIVVQAFDQGDSYDTNKTAGARWVALGLFVQNSGLLTAGGLELLERSLQWAGEGVADGGGQGGSGPSLDPATSIFVSLLGDDITGDGTEGNPYRTLDEAVNHTTAARRFIWIKAGTYDERPRFAVNGSAGAEIEIAPYPGDEGQVVFTTGDSSSGKAIYPENCSYVKLIGLEVTNSLFGIYGSNCSHFTVDNCYIHQLGQEGIHFFDGSNNCTIRYCRIGERGLRGNAFCEGIYLGWGADPASDPNCHTFFIENCELFGTGSEIVDIKPYVQLVVIRNCYIHDVVTRRSGLVAVGIGSGTSNTFGGQFTNPANVIIEDCVFNEYVDDSPGVNPKDANGIVGHSAFTARRNSFANYGDRAIFIEEAGSTTVNFIVEDNIAYETGKYADSGAYVYQDAHTLTESNNQVITGQIPQATLDNALAKTVAKVSGAWASPEASGSQGSVAAQNEAELTTPWTVSPGSSTASTPGATNQAELTPPWTSSSSTSSVPALAGAAEPALAASWTAEQGLGETGSLSASSVTPNTGTWARSTSTGQIGAIGVATEAAQTAAWQSATASALAANAGPEAGTGLSVAWGASQATSQTGGQSAVLGDPTIAPWNSANSTAQAAAAGTTLGAAQAAPWAVSTSVASAPDLAAQRTILDTPWDTPNAIAQTGQVQVLAGSDLIASWEAATASSSRPASSVITGQAQEASWAIAQASALAAPLGGELGTEQAATWSAIVAQGDTGVLGAITAILRAPWATPLASAGQGLLVAGIQSPPAPSLKAAAGPLPPPGVPVPQPPFLMAANFEFELVQAVAYDSRQIGSELQNPELVQSKLTITAYVQDTYMNARYDQRSPGISQTSIPLEGWTRSPMVVDLPARGRYKATWTHGGRTLEGELNLLPTPLSADFRTQLGTHFMGTFLVAGAQQQG